jgi:predicted ATPase
MPPFPITKLEVQNFRRFGRFSISFKEHNVFVGPNNSGKSSLLDAFRILNSCFRSSRRLNPALEGGESGVISGYSAIPDASIPVPLANITQNYSEEDAQFLFSHRNGNKLRILLHPNRLTRCHLLSDTELPRTSSAFRRAFPVELVVIPPLGPFEEEEDYVQDQTIARNRFTRLANRYFRNIWYRADQDEFEAFKFAVEDSWPGITISKPEPSGHPAKLFMFYRENRIDKEMYWSGYGFQIWLQILTYFTTRPNNSVLVMDEPDIYLHPDLQQKLLRLAKSLFTETIFATHSVEIINASSSADLVLINPGYRRARRVATDYEYQDLLNYLGSADNVEFPRMARARRIIFFEGKDKKILSKLAACRGLSIDEKPDTLILEVGGFGQWRRVREVAWAIRHMFRMRANVMCLFDRDYRSPAEMEKFKDDMSNEGITCLVLGRKELENYIIVPEALVRLVTSRIRQRRRPIPQDLVEQITNMICEETERLKFQVESQLAVNRIRYCRDTGDRRDDSDIARAALEEFADSWGHIEGRLKLVPGKELITALSQRFQQAWNVSISPLSLTGELKGAEIDPELGEILDQLDLFANTDGQ